MGRLLPIVIAVAAIVSLTVVQGLMTERWGSNQHCSYCATLLDEVPESIGPWSGSDSEVTTLVREASGARGYVSRTYKNAQTGEQVGVWLIVGHARDTARHTPDVCYKADGFAADRDHERYEVDLGAEAPTTFWTGLFRKETTRGPVATRVFWTWFLPRKGSGEPVAWRAPEDRRGEFKAAPALYKLYFTTHGDAAMPEPDANVAMQFAREFFDAVEPILTKANGAVPDGFVPPPETDAV
ncbi:MAG: exosortase-associated EpsI family protein [Planctomycetota bacterium]